MKLQDMNDGKPAALAVGWCEAFFRAMIEHAFDGIGVFAADGTTLYVSPQVEHFLGIAAADCLGLDVFDAVAPERRTAAQERFAALVERPGAVVTAETELWHRCGRRLPVEVTATNLLHVPAVAGIVVNYRDLTHRRRSELALAESEERFRTLFHKSADATLILGRHGALECNRAAVDLLGVPGREALLGTTPLDLAPEFQPDGRRSAEMGPAMVELARSHGHHCFEWTLRRMDGRCVPLDVTMTAMVLRGRTVLHCVLRDLSARKALERRLNERLEAGVRRRSADLDAGNRRLSRAMNQLVQSEQRASLGTLVAGIAHELSTPLGNALAVAASLAERVEAIAHSLDQGMLRKSQLDEFVGRCRESAALLERNTRRAADMVGSFKQIAVDQSSVRRRRFDLGQLLHEVGLTLQPLFAPTGHRLAIDASPGLVMDSYPGPLEQVITNLVANALHHAFATPAGGVVELCASRDGDGHVRLLVHDNGAGMAEELVPRAFDPFFTTRTDGGGSGLGLYIVRNLVTGVLGGRVELKSRPGYGTEADIVMPAVAPILPAEPPAA